MKKGRSIARRTAHSLLIQSFSGGLHFERLNFLFDLRFLRSTGNTQVIIGLEIHPKVWSRPKCVGEPKSHLWRDTALLIDNVIDGRGWNT
jgi:hypothetical protein